MVDASLSRTASASAAAPLRIRRLVLFGAVLPAAIAAVNYALGSRTSDTFQLCAQLAWHVLQVGIVGYAVGRGIERPALRWIVFGWLIALINLLTWIEGSELSRSQQSARLPIAALFGGQIGLFVAWAFLGDTRWQIRWPAMTLLAAALGFVWLRQGDPSSRGIWSELLALDVLTLATLCLLLRQRGFVLRRLDSEGAPPVGAASPRPLQFGIKHVLVWTTVLAVLLGIARAMDMLRWHEGQDQFRLGLLWKLIVATITGIVFVVALWVALGRGHWLMRYTVGALFVLLSGGGLAAWSQSNAAALSTAVMRWRGIYPQATYDLLRWYEVGWWWLGWLFLSGGLLAATLIILRTIGYRLVRLAPATSNSRQ